MRTLSTAAVSPRLPVFFRTLLTPGRASTGAGLIAPCSCAGTSAWVHRGCLDQWRSTQEDRAFSQCTECKFPYEYVQPAADEEDDRGWLFDGGPLTARRRRWAKFQLFVARDFVAIFVVLQLCICLVSTTVRRMDCGTWLACSSNCTRGFGGDPTFRISDCAGLSRSYPSEIAQSFLAV